MLGKRPPSRSPESQTTPTPHLLSDWDGASKSENGQLRRKRNTTDSLIPGSSQQGPAESGEGMEAAVPWWELSPVSNPWGAPSHPTSSTLLQGPPAQHALKPLTGTHGGQVTKKEK